MSRDTLALSTPSVRQHTLSTTVVWRGNVRKGQRGSLLLHPAAADSGIRLRRRGVLPEHSVIDARWDAIIGTEPSAVLANREGVSVRGATTLLAALRALGVDNVLVEIDGREIPAGVAMFRAYIELLVEAGLQAQDGPRRALRIEQAVEVRDSFGFAALSPAPEFCVRLGLAGTDPAGGGLVSGALASDLTEPAAAVHPRRGAGSDPDTPAALGHAPLWDLATIAPLLRPRMIDTIGHLALAGAPLLGHMRGYRSGPGLHQALLRAVMLRRAAAWVTVDEHRTRLLADPDDPEGRWLLADIGPSGYYH